MLNATANGKVRNKRRPSSGQLEGRPPDFLSVVTSDPVGLRVFLDGTSAVIRADALTWLQSCNSNSIHAVVTDPPYSLIEYESGNHTKLRQGKGGVWRIPPSFDGVQRSPLPRFTVVTEEDTARLRLYFTAIARELLRILVPGGHVFIASNPLLSTLTFG